jgi:hypothetical protein
VDWTRKTGSQREKQKTPLKKPVSKVNSTVKIVNRQPSHPSAYADISSVKKSHHNCVQLRDNSRYVILITTTVMVICLHYTILFEIGMMQPIVII